MSLDSRQVGLFQETSRGKHSLSMKTMTNDLRSYEYDPHIVRLVLNKLVGVGKEGVLTE